MRLKQCVKSTALYTQGCETKAWLLAPLHVQSSLARLSPMMLSAKQQNSKICDNDIVEFNSSEMLNERERRTCVPEQATNIGRAINTEHCLLACEKGKQVKN